MTQKSVRPNLVLRLQRRQQRRAHHQALQDAFEVHHDQFGGRRFLPNGFLWTGRFLGHVRGVKCMTAVHSVQSSVM